MASSSPDRLLAGSAYPLGATSDGLGVNFAVFSAHASRIELCVFDARGQHCVQHYDLPECTDEIWHGYLPDAQPGLTYGYRAHGPYDPHNGHRFNPHKLLLDPYARQLTGAPRWHDALFGYRLDHDDQADLSLDQRDSAPYMPKAIVPDPAFDWGGVRRPATPWDRTLLYEVHLRGASMQRDDLEPRLRGSAAALADPRFVAHLYKLGVTAVELLPVQAFLQDRFLIERGLSNYWGYSPLAYFAPEPAYLTDGGPNDLKQAIRQLHGAGIEVILDVVYNHTCEGNELGPTLSWRGLDNASYYRLRPDDRRHHIDHTGCGNTLNLSHPRVLQMVMDSLRYWADEYQVDGFRFDLGTTLGREDSGFDPGAGFFDAILQDPALASRKLIGEPWDIGPDGYQLGRQPPRFAEWNDQYRDAIRRFWRGDASMIGALATRMAGSRDLFDRRHRRPWASVNFVTAHDGFTLADLVSYSERHNQANGEANRDGHGENYSANWGEEGPSACADVLDLRGRAQRAMLATLLLSDGTPMLLGGDEFGNAQAGNNNAYCQDNAVSWLDWQAAASDAGRALTRFVSRCTALRREHPSLRAARYVDGAQALAPGLSRQAWFDAQATCMESTSWEDPQRRTLQWRRVAEQDDDAERLDVTLLLLNGSDQAVRFRLPEPRQDWQIALDSVDPQRCGAAPSDTLELGPRSLVLLVAQARQ